MLVVVIVALVAIAGAVALLASSLGLGRDDRRGVSDLGRTGWLIGGAAVGLVTILLVGGATIGVGVGRSGSTASITPSSTLQPRPAAPSGIEQAAPAERRGQLILDASKGREYPSPMTALGNLVDGDVVAVRAHGFASNASGQVAQCQRVGANFDGCFNAFPIHFDEGGFAELLYVVREPAGCSPTCTLALAAGDEVASSLLYFGSAVPPQPRVAVDYEAPLGTGDPVTLTVSDATPGARLRALACRPHTPVPGGCRAVPGLEQIDVGSDGGVVARGVLGRVTGWCDRGARCALALVDESDALAAEVSRMSFAPSTVTHYDRRRLLAALVLAAALLAIAAWLVRSTEWKEPSEASVEPA
jgi:hypothetical protein